MKNSLVTNVSNNEEMAMSFRSTLWHIMVQFNMFIMVVYPISTVQFKI